jgi:hypothetical protein
VNAEVNIVKDTAVPIALRKWLLRITMAPAAIVLLVLLAIAAQAQSPGAPPTDISAIRHNSGEAVIPYFEGWIRNPDGTFDMVFGYFNRNYVQELTIPAGAANSVEPGPADQGQPTYFLPRRQRYMYRVRVPADFGRKDVVWTITANGHTEKGYGSLIPQEEITERVIMTSGGYDPGLNDPNKPPSIAISQMPMVTSGVPVTLTATVTDDGLPKPRPVSTTPRNTKAATGGFGGQVNSSTAPVQRELTLTWLQYGGPAKVTFGRNGAAPVANGQSATTATFAAPGTYKLVAIATDPGRLSTRTIVTVAAR